MVGLSNIMTKKFSDEELDEVLNNIEKFDVDGETVMVAPAGGFYSSPNVGLNQVRIAYVLQKESLVRAVHILKEALKQYNT